MLIYRFWWYDKKKDPIHSKEHRIIEEISVTDLVPKLKQPRELLNHILNQPELPAIIQSLDATVLTKLIRHVGLEDSAEIISMATVDQLKSIFDEDLWRNDTPGRDEFFDADRFGLWLEIILETGSAFAARKLMELDEDLLTLGLCQLVLVVDLDELTLRMSNSWRSAKDDLLDKVLESTLNQEFDSYLVIAKSDWHWDAILTLLTELNESDHVILNHLLERCYRISWEYIEDNGGLFDVLTAEEMLEEDLAAEREARRKSSGFVSPAAALFFLNMARTTALKKIISAKTLDPDARAYLKAAETITESMSASRATVKPTETTPSENPDLKTLSFLQTLQAAEVLPSSDQKRLSLPAEPFDHHLPLAKAMRLINLTDSTLYSRRLTELTYLSNILISGCGFQRRTFRPIEAAEAAFSVCNLGGEYLLRAETAIEEAQSIELMAELLKIHHLIKLFQVGWKILNDDVIYDSAKALLKFLDRLKDVLSDPQQSETIVRIADILQSRISAGQPLRFDNQLDQLHAFLDGETIMALTGLLQEYPTMSEIIHKKGHHRPSPFIWSHAHIRTIRQFLKDAILWNAPAKPI